MWLFRTVRKLETPGVEPNCCTPNDNSVSEQLVACNFRVAQRTLEAMATLSFKFHNFGLRLLQDDECYLLNLHLLSLHTYIYTGQYI